MTETLTPKIGTPSLVIPSSRFTAKDKTYYEVQFREEPPNGVPNILSLPTGVNPPDLGRPIIYTTTPVERAGGQLNKIGWPTSPQLIPADIRAAHKKLVEAGVVEEVAEVTQPVTNPVEAPVTEPSEVKVPEVVLVAPDTDRKIVRQSVLKCAVDYWSRQGTSPENPGVAIRLMAEWMEEWVFRGVEKK
jgi:hypothetical protein